MNCGSVGSLGSRVGITLVPIEPLISEALSRGWRRCRLKKNAATARIITQTTPPATPIPAIRDVERSEDESSGELDDTTSEELVGVVMVVMVVAARGVIVRVDVVSIVTWALRTLYGIHFR